MVQRFRRNGLAVPYSGECRATFENDVVAMDIDSISHGPAGTKVLFPKGRRTGATNVVFSVYIPEHLAQPVSGIARFHAFRGGSKSLAADITIYMIGVIAGVVLRIFLMKREALVSWIAFAYLLGGMIWFFTYFSYSDDIYVGYWFDPNPYNHTTSEDEEH